MKVPEEPVCIDLFRQNPVFTSLYLKSPVHVHRLCSVLSQGQLCSSGHCVAQYFIVHQFHIHITFRITVQSITPQVNNADISNRGLPYP
jgi:hypothetical protein